MAERTLLFIGNFGSEEIDTAADTATLAGLTVSSAAGIDMGGFGISNLAAPTNATDAATKAYVDLFAGGLDFKGSVRLATAAALPAYTPAGSGVGKTLTADANGALSVDGVAVAVGNRILVKSEGASDADHGIYVVTATGDGSNPFVLTRATDADIDAEVTAGMFLIVEEGSTQADSAWILTTNNPIVVDTTALAFQQFPTAVSYGAGLILSGSTVNVELDADADAQTAGADGGSSGLEFDVTGAGGQLRARVDPAGGIQRGVSGLALEIDDTPNTLDVDADGLKVVGLPLEFLINGAATSTNVTAANVNTLTAGLGSSADALHRHARIEETFEVGAATDAGDPVYYSAADVVSPADAAGGVGTGNQVIGVARTTQATIGQDSEIVRAGPCAGVLSGATAGTAYWLASGGGLTTTAPTGNVDRVLVGYAINATDLDVRIQYIGKLN